MEKTGTVKWFNIQKGYGFLSNPEGDSDVFVHITALEKAGIKELKEGQKVKFEIFRDPNTQKNSAMSLKIVS